MVYAQRTIQIGTIAVSQVVQPAIAVVWSFLLLGETVRSGQVIGIAIATVGLAAFILINQRGERARSIIGPAARPAEVDASIVAMSTHGETSLLERRILGSVTAWVIREAFCPVLVRRPARILT
jgi:nucleotide-binding universal stress UspA family protein